MPSQDDDSSAQFASPPCFMHELDESHSSFRSEPRPESNHDVARWRKAERERLITDRLSISPDLRNRHAASIIKRLDAIIGSPIGYIGSGY